MSELPGGEAAWHAPDRLEAFSDGVMAVIITIMALELKAPVSGTFHALEKSLPGLLVYILSFAFIGIYWNNHHHLLRATPRISGAVMWANLHLLFWLSLIPVVTEWVGTDYRSHLPASVYGVVGLAAAVAYGILVRTIIRANGAESEVARSVGRDRKGNASIVIYALGVGLAWVTPWIAYALFVTVSIIWFVPDRRLNALGGPAGG
ncbi:MAG TPA: TMEM175 family protein [Acidimicrobiales bacterium]|nr:TMEM175 family protein [Acidimicrobiales bacterium]